VSERQRTSDCHSHKSALSSFAGIGIGIGIGIGWPSLD
jgi:hypothetical protein